MVRRLQSHNEPTIWRFPRNYQRQLLAENAVLGVLVDFFGNELLTIRAPFAGVVNYVISTPRE